MLVTALFPSSNSRGPGLGVSEWRGADGGSACPARSPCARAGHWGELAGPRVWTGLVPRDTAATVFVARESALALA